MGRGRKWENDEMWEEAVRWRKGGKSYRDIEAKLARLENMRRFGLEEVPSEDTIGREVKRRLASEEAAPGEPQLTIRFDPQRPEDLGLKTLDDDKPWQVACPRVESTRLAAGKGCLTKFTLVSGATLTGSEGPFSLNPVDKAWGSERDSAEPVNIPPGQHWSWDLVFAPPGREQTRETAITSGGIYKDTVPGDVRGRPPPGMDWTKGGACIGTPIAIARRGVPQCYLLPGEYIGRLDVYDELGNKGEALFRIRAPQPGGKLEVSLVSESAKDLLEKLTYPLGNTRSV